MPAERTVNSYGPSITAASKSVLLELTTILRSYHEALILVGGWVPYFLLEKHRRKSDDFSHVGSIDIDLVIDPEKVKEPQYATIVELLSERGYRQAIGRRGQSIPCSMERESRASLTGKPYTIRIDFLASQAEGTGNMPVQDDLLARKLEGCEAALKYQTRIELSGKLPDGAELTLPIRMADLVGSLTMKGIVLGARYREKDAYDIYALAAHYGNGPKDVAAAIKPHLNDPMVMKAMQSIRQAFSSRQANGSVWAANFITNPIFEEAYQQCLTDVYMTVNEFQEIVNGERIAKKIV